MAQSRQYVDQSGTPVNWSTAVVGGVAQVDVYEVVGEDQHSNTLLWARAGSAVSAARVAAALDAATSGTVNRALASTLTTTLEVARPAGDAVRYLPSGASSGTVRAVQNTGTAPIRVTPTSSDTIDGGTAAAAARSPSSRPPSRRA